MITSESTANNRNLEEVSISSFIPGLPDDISLLCLARVPRRLHHVLRCVSKTWRALVSSKQFLLCRRENNLQESWLYALCRDSDRRNCCYVLDPDPAQRCWRLLPGIPLPCEKRDGMSFEAIGQKLFLLGGCSWNQDATDEVYCYDAASSSWEPVAPMPKPRCYFVSATVDRKLFVTDGEGMNSESLQSLDTYDMASNSWSAHEDPKVPSGVRKFVALGSRLYSIHSTYQDAQKYAGEYDLSTGSWRHISNDIALCWRGPTVVVEKTLYMLDEAAGMKLVKWQEETGQWLPVGRLSRLVTGSHCELAADGSKVYIICQGLKTLIVDLIVASKSGGMLVSSPLIPGLDSQLSVVTCKIISI